MGIIFDLLKAAGGEAGLPSSLGIWRQRVSQELEGLLAAVEDVVVPGGGVLPPAPISVLATFGSFYAQMPGDNAATIAVGAPMLFPQDGPYNTIVRNGASPSEFVLPAIGVYEVSWQVSVDEGAGNGSQLMLSLNGTPADETVAGRTTATSQVLNTAIITTTAANSILRLLNPVGNAAALTITPIAGGATAVSAWLVIKRLA